MKNIYIVISQTGSIVSKIIHRVTGDKYTHASISFDDDLGSMYSFGRVFPSNPIIGGFVKESVSYGTMKKFRLANIVVLQITVEDDLYFEINSYIESMYLERRKYHYNYIGLFLAKRGLHFHRDNHYYCSEFIKEILEHFNLVDGDELASVVRPVEFLHLRRGKVIFEGKLCDFRCS